MGWTRASIDARLEDLTWMAETGETATGAANRLGITRNALEAWCRRGHADLWKLLVAREPRDPHYRSKAHGIWGQAS